MMAYLEVMREMLDGEDCVKCEEIEVKLSWDKMFVKVEEGRQQAKASVDDRITGTTLAVKVGFWDYSKRENTHIVSDGYCNSNHRQVFAILRAPFLYWWWIL
jgi:hypothetical protein